MNPSLQASLLAPTPTVPLRPAAPTSPFHPNQSSIPARYHQRQASSSDSSEAGPASPRHAPPPPPPPETSRRTPKPNLSSSPPTPTPTPALAVPIPSSQPSRLQRNAPSPAPPILDPAVDVHALGHIKDLEDQLQMMKNENEQQKAQLARYRDRWQKLKDNAKRKQQKLATTTASTTAAEPTTGSNDFGATGTTPPSIIHIAPPAPLPVPAPPTSSSSSPISTRSHHVRAPTSPRVSRRSAAGTVPKPLSEDED
ncbi:hypothetical protein DL93DRAFT_2083463 [Clavulina sp. PMI_390]|nr:hypothetical protein DL93DRAFT_2083463 [Clavulina sp. PMI_390]